MAGISSQQGDETGAGAKREVEEESVKQEEGDTQAHKRARTDGEAAESGSCLKKEEVKAETETGSPAKLQKIEMLPALALEQAVHATTTASGLEVELTKTRVEVCWEVADDEAEDPRPITLW
jgi:hypothetical protein